MKILLYDIETSPLLSYTWGMYKQNVIEVERDWYMLAFAYKWLDEKKTYVKGLIDYKTTYKKNIEDDSMLVKDLWKLLDEADVVIGHNCVEENTKILKADLTWVKAGELKSGDKLAGFEEQKSKKNQSRQLKESIVESNYIQEAECLEVELSNGEKLITTLDHKWLKLAPRGREYAWCETQNLKIGQRVERFFKPWQQEKSYEAGWMSGFIEGEGTLKMCSKKGCPASIDFCQRPTVVLERALEYCKKLGIKLGNLYEKKGGLGRGDALYTYTLGGKFKTVETLGRLDIQRLTGKIDWNNMGSLKSSSSETLDIVGIKNIGIQKVAVIQTTSKTFFAEGYAMHNCNAFDIKKSNAKFVALGLGKPSFYQTVDTLKVARKYFKFTSNKLDNLGNLLGVGRKVETGGFSLWKGCMRGDTKSWKLMLKYNKQDVNLLEDVYLKLRPWMENHPNHNLYDGSNGHCPICGSSKLQKRGFARTRVSKFQRFQCKDCGGWSQKRLREPETVSVK